MLFPTNSRSATASPTKLLVSVREPSEVASAIEGGADFIDIKEPAAGPLGAADPETARQIVRAVAGRKPVSIALGELCDLKCEQIDSYLAIEGVTFFKAGLSALRDEPDWLSRWTEFCRHIGPHAHPVAVAYVDHHLAAAPPVEQIAAAAAGVGCAALLLDTFDKQAGPLWQHVGVDQVAGLIEGARRSGLLSVVGGSLTTARLGQLADCPPDVVAVRGGVCDRGRAGPVATWRVTEFANAIRTLRRTGAASEKAEFA